MIQKIRKGDLTCGYVFPDTLKKQYENGQYEKCIKQYHSEGNAFFLIAREAVISSVFRVYGRQMLEDYIAQSGLFESHEIEKGEISQKYKDNLAKQQTFTMEINQAEFCKKTDGRLSFGTVTWWCGFFDSACPDSVGLLFIEKIVGDRFLLQLLENGAERCRFFRLRCRWF